MLPKQEVEVKLRVADAASMQQRMARLHARAVRPRMHEINTLYDTPDLALGRRGQMLRIRVERRAGRDLRKGSGRAAARNEEVVTLTYKGRVAGGAEAGGAEAVGKRDAFAAASEGGSSQGKAGAGNRYKIRDEREVRLADAQAGAHILEAFGLVPQFRYEKYRTTYQLPGHLPKRLLGRAGAIEVDLDETPIGNFLELEGSQTAIDCVARWLGFSPADYIVESYAALFVETFAGKKRGEQVQNEPGWRQGLPDMLFVARDTTGRAKKKKASEP